MHPQLRFGGHTVGEGSPCFIIAEACDNHLGNMTTAKQMIVESKRAGASAVKFQHHLADVEMLPDLPMSDNFEQDLPLYAFLKKYALTLDQHSELKKYAEEEIGITYMCTPFSYQAAVELETIGLTSFKIGSGEMTDVPSLERISDFKKPMIVSTGMSTWEEIDRTYTALIAKNTPLALMNCVSEYPPAYEDVNIDVITEMKERFPKAVIGHSDHTPDIYTCFAAVTLGAHILEKHVILDKKQKGPDQAVSINFDELAMLVDGVRKIEAARGTERKVHSKEQAIRTWAFRYVVAVRGLRKGDVITQEMIQSGHLWTKRTGRPDGIRSHDLPRLVGKRATRDVAPNSPLFWEDLEA